MCAVAVPPDTVGQHATVFHSFCKVKITRVVCNVYVGWLWLCIEKQTNQQAGKQVQDNNTQNV